ncbi:Retrovirus-related Pol polyprotein from transposon opus [Cucumis melo var. makuwa]|uniref:Retrovirus-related Pol polyprotein from transposon opus n=1 Tax=Cucumis melo var. makuwa TaxID=1194695 RepID=A0A5A7V7C3_CUCMM|nr:Retrovirus-related Pol polyprotein from transposon opus [Cucumis melo var. makuwa]TYK26167.1 Retrovirus-related Pol polyprotein from transposon opus [Cucumis melo var. makuwa]
MTVFEASKTEVNGRPMPPTRWRVAAVQESFGGAECQSVVHLSGTSPVLTVFDQYANVFEWSDKLPQRKDIEHHILLKKGIDPINVRPCRYGYHEKEEMEKLVGEMFASEFPFSSPVLLVKKDGSWRIYVDYRGVNNATIPNKFPIPVVEELFDELGEASLFSIIDLKSGSIRYEWWMKALKRQHLGLMRDTMSS